MKSNEVEKVTPVNQMPDYLKDAAKGNFGDVDSGDIIMPRLKLIQAVSPEITSHGVKTGQYFHTIAEQEVGDQPRFIPMQLTKAYNIWAPRGSDSPILARSSDAKVWDARYQNTVVKWTPKGKKKPVEIKLGVSVDENGLTDFGSSDPENENSAPIATLAYNVFGYVLDWGPAIFSMSRSSAKVAKQLISKIEFRGVPPHSQLFIMGSRAEKGTEGDYLVPTFRADGFASKEDYERCDTLIKKFAGKIVRTRDEDAGEDAPAGGVAEPTRTDI